MIDRKLSETGRLVADARRGSRAAYDELFARHRAELVRCGRGRLDRGLRTRAGESDVVQDALLDAVQAFGSFEYAGPGSFGAWLARILENRARKLARFHRRAWKRSVDREARTSPPDPSSAAPLGSIAVDPRPSPSSIAAARERIERIEAALATLPSDYREVIRRMRIEGARPRDVARAMERSENAVKKLLSRALFAVGASARAAEADPMRRGRR
jgi:RNA polymerase sigma-70 factor (ECF subfamily)